MGYVCKELRIRFEEDVQDDVIDFLNKKYQYNVYKILKSDDKTLWIYDLYADPDSAIDEIINMNPQKYFVAEAHNLSENCGICFDYKYVYDGKLNKEESENYTEPY